MEMNRGHRVGYWGILLLLAVAGEVSAAGAWVPDPGDGWFSVGFNRKSGDRRLDDDSSEFIPSRGRTHDFRYAYFSGEAGLLKNLAANWTVTYLWATESFDIPEENFSHDGFSDMWVGLRYQLKRGRLPLVAEFNARLPYLYEHHDRYLGVLKHDFSGLLYVERPTGSAGTFGGYGGYTFRQGSPTNQVRLGTYWVVPETSSMIRKIPFRITVGLDGFVSVGEPSPSDSSDRFSYRPRRPTDVNYFTFNKSSWAKPWVDFSRPLGNTDFGFDFGYGMIGPGNLGSNVHEYGDLYFSVYRSF
jgi:hypothetical protein